MLFTWPHYVKHALFYLLTSNPDTIYVFGLTITIYEYYRGKFNWTGQSCLPIAEFYVITIRLYTYHIGILYIHDNYLSPTFGAVLMSILLIVRFNISIVYCLSLKTSKF